MMILYIFAALIAAATTLAFTFLKLYSVVQWSWLMVLSPIWILWILLVVGLTIAYVTITIKEHKEKARRSGQPVML